MCLANAPTRPTLSDALPSAKSITELGNRLQQPGYQHTIGDAATCYMVAASLRHTHELVVGEEAFSIDAHTKRVVLSTLTGIRALAETELQHGNEHWRRAVLLIDNAIEELDQ
jgi:hypothetical protein